VRPGNLPHVRIREVREVPAEAPLWNTDRVLAQHCTVPGQSAAGCGNKDVSGHLPLLEAGGQRQHHEVRAVGVSRVVLEHDARTPSGLNIAAALRLKKKHVANLWRLWLDTIINHPALTSNIGIDRLQGRI